MCDSLVALPPATAGKNVIFGKSADCQVNEAHALVRIPRKRHFSGETFRATHIVIPQVEETYEVLLSKSFWTWGCEMGINEHGLAMGNEAVWSTVQNDETVDGLISMDLMRLALERARTCQEAIDVIGSLLKEYGQGGNCELSGNSHFDCLFIVSDTKEAYVLETAGREWSAKRIETIGSISNAFTINDDWDQCSLAVGDGKLNWTATYEEPEIVPLIGSRERQATTYQGLATAQGNIDIQTAFDILRHHGDDYHPAVGDVATNICVHAGPQEYRQWQATGAMASQVSSDGILAWVTGTSGTCVSIFKPVFLGVEMPDIGPVPTERFNADALWWKHELLHRRAMTNFGNLVPAIREDFNALEAEFLAEAVSVLKGTDLQKKGFMDHCFRKAEEATKKWTDRLAARTDLKFEDPAYRNMWAKYNREAGVTDMPT